MIICINWSISTNIYPHTITITFIIEIYCVQTPQSDSQTVTTVTTDAIKKYDPDLVPMSGICSGKEEDSKIGDLVVCKEVFNVDVGAIHSKNGVRFHAKAERPTAKDFLALEVHLKSLAKQKTGWNY